MTDQRLYIITATRNGNGLPTFYLDGDVLGITSSKHATDIAVSILGHDWETPQSESGEYCAVSAYPLFDSEGFGYDNGYILTNF